MNIIKDENHDENDVAEGQDGLIEDWDGKREGNQHDWERLV